MTPLELVGLVAVGAVISPAITASVNLLVSYIKKVTLEQRPTTEGKTTPAP